MAIKESSKESIPVVAVSILDKEYRVNCPEEERKALSEAAQLVNSKMREIRDAGRVLGNERIAVMAALNLAYDFLQYKAEKDEYAQAVSLRVRHLQEKIDAVLKIG